MTKINDNIAYEARPEFLKGSKGVGILVIHGFTGSTQSMRPIAYQLNKLGYTINMPCLAGHGTSPEEMEKTGYKDWTNSVEQAYKQLKNEVNEVFVLGLSMGGTLTLYSAINFKIKGVITINAAIELSNFEHLYNDPSTPEFIQGIGSDIKKEGIKEWAYDKTPKKCIGEIIQLTKIVRENLSKITCPALIFKSLEDHIVPPENQDYIYMHLKGEKELVELKNSYHVATLDNDMDIIIRKTNQFINDNI